MICSQLSHCILTTIGCCKVHFRTLLTGTSVLFAAIIADIPVCKQLKDNDLQTRISPLKLPPGWEVENVSVSLTGAINGFYAETFVHRSSSGIIDEVVIAFRGTNPPKLSISSWVEFGIDVAYENCLTSSTIGTLQFNSTSKYFEEMTKKYSGINIKVTGHSLGGCLVSYITKQYGSESIIFNASPRGVTGTVGIEESNDFLDVIRSERSTDLVFTDSQGHSIYNLASGMQRMVSEH